MVKDEIEIGRLVRKLQGITGRFITIGAVESATGGGIADRITNVAGSSDYFPGALVSYSNSIKESVAGVRHGTLLKYGAVSHETAREMAAGGRRLLNVDICVSTTGIAGPGGATPVKPVGLFYMGIAAGRNLASYKFTFPGSRLQVKRQAADVALELIKEKILGMLCKAEKLKMQEKHVVTCFLEHNGQILLLRRSGKVGTYRRNWAGVSGYIETDAITQAYTEIREETTLPRREAALITQGEPVEVLDPGLQTRWMVHPFLFHIRDPKLVKTDWEHTESRWIRPATLRNYHTVPGLLRVLATVWTVK